MPYSPTTPHRRRPSSGFDLSFASESPQSPTYAAIRPSHSRKSSVQSILSLRTPTSPRPPSSHDRNGGFNFSNDFGGSGDARNGLGSLADELAEGWDEDGEVEDGSSMMLSEDRGYDGQVPTPASPQFDHSTIGLALSPLHEQPNGSLSPPKKSFRSRRLGKPSDYDGSDYGEGSDFEGTRISPSLDTRMAVIESLARQGAASTEVEANGVFFRVADSLRELGSQASVESHATRLATAHIALTTHLTHQTRLLATLAHPLLSPLSVPPAAETIDPLLPLLTSLILALPQPPSTPMPALHALHTSTIDLLSTLSYLSDTLHMTRQTTTLAARRLRAAREAVETLRREMEEAEEGRRWLETGRWERKLREREAARVCGEVVGGFEEVCAGWRDRLLRQGGGVVEVGAG